MKHHPIVLLAIVLLVGACQPQRIHVDSPQAFLDALGPNRSLVLRGDVRYTLDDLPRGVSHYYRWDGVMPDQMGLVIRHCEGLAIMAEPTDEPAHIVTAHPYANVLSFENCQQLTLVNLKVGHHPDPGYCSGGVLALTDCDGVRIGNTTLYGCGTDGLMLRRVNDLTVEDSVIENCVYGLLSADGCNGLTFRRSIFRDTKEFYGFVLRDTVDVRLQDCRIESIVTYRNSALFETNLTVEAGRILMTGGSIRGNTAAHLVRPEGMLVLDGVDVRNNSWQRSLDVRAIE